MVIRGGTSVLYSLIFHSHVFLISIALLFVFLSFLVLHSTMIILILQKTLINQFIKLLKRSVTDSDSNAGNNVDYSLRQVAM